MRNLASHTHEGNVWMQYDRLILSTFILNSILDLSHDSIVSNFNIKSKSEKG